MNPWWRGYFDEQYIRAYRPLLDDQLSAAEASAAAQLLDLETGARVLDLACGWGRHSRPLHAAGYGVTGVDLSLHLLETARAGDAPGGSNPAWVVGDLRHLPLSAGFDAVVSIFSSLGYLDEEDEVRALREVRRVLAPAGRLLIEGTHRDQVAREYAERDWWEGEDGATVRVEREFDAVAGVSHECMYVSHAGEEREKHHRIRIRTPGEWGDLLARAGLEPEAWYGNWDGSHFETSSERLIVIARC